METWIKHANTVFIICVCKNNAKRDLYQQTKLRTSTKHVGGCTVYYYNCSQDSEEKEKGPTNPNNTQKSRVSGWSCR